MQSMHRQLIVPLVAVAAVMIVLTPLLRDMAIVLWLGAVVLGAIALGAGLIHQSVRHRVVAVCTFLAALVITYLLVGRLPAS